MSKSQFEKMCRSLKDVEHQLGLSRHTVEVQDGIINELRDEIERLRGLVDAGKEDRKAIDELVDENLRLRKALVDIRDSRHCEYYVNGVSPYGVGVTDGHRCCSLIARVAL